MNKAITNNRGVALLITISVAAILITVAMTLNKSVRHTVMTTANTRDHYKMLNMATSGIHAAMAILIKDRAESEIDTIQEDWAIPEKVAAITDTLLFDDGKVTVRISDELSRIQVNSIVTYPDRRDFNPEQVKVWERFIENAVTVSEHYKDISQAEIINSLKDWIDTGDDEAITGLTGAESDYYVLLDPAYICTNLPFDHPDNILMVKGITPEFFYGTEGMPGLYEFITVHGITSLDTGDTPGFPGQININTAAVPVLAALLPQGDKNLAMIMAEYRDEKNSDTYINGLTAPGWYNNIPGLSDIKLNETVIRTNSDIFRINAVAEINNSKLGIVTVIQREKYQKSGKWYCTILEWHIL
ncbi:MAG: general secretion pathway protein GspK [Desulfobacterales bacterium]|nr:general secretion pathway protein GspK [Desulfobacterales bacterium]